jgi:hypothetical protein
MPVNQNEVNALLAEIQSDANSLANAIKMRDAALKTGDTRTRYSQDLFIHELENKYRSESDKSLNQVYSDIALDARMKKYEEQLISARVDKLKAAMKPDKELENYKKQYVEYTTQVYKSRGLSMTPQLISAANLNAVQEFSKQKQEYQELKEVTRIFDNMVNFANSDNGKKNTNWDALRKMSSDISAQTISSPYTVQSPSGIDAKNIAMKKLITALGDKPITMENMVNHFKELNTKQQNQSRPLHGISMKNVETTTTPNIPKDTTKGADQANTMF